MKGKFYSIGWGRKGRIESDINSEANINSSFSNVNPPIFKCFLYRAYIRVTPSLLLLWLLIWVGGGMWIFGGFRWYNYYVLINILSSFWFTSAGYCCLLTVFPSHRFPKCHLSFLFVFTLVISLGLPSEVPRNRSNCRHGISEVAIKFTKLVILCRKKYNLGLLLIIYGFLLWVGFLFWFGFYFVWGWYFFEL